MELDDYAINVLCLISFHEASRFTDVTLQLSETTGLFGLPCVFHAKDMGAVRIFPGWEATRTFAYELNYTFKS